MPRKRRYEESRLVKFIKKYTVVWYAVTVVFYLVMIPATVWVFPATTLLLSVFVLFAGFTAALASLASAIVQAEQDKAIATAQETVDEVAEGDVHDEQDAVRSEV